MTTGLATTTTTDLAQPRPLPSDRNPAAVYVARLAPGSRRAMTQSLEVVAELLTGGRVRAVDLDWSQVRYQHAAAVRAALAESCAPATANRHLSALRGVLREAWRLGHMTAEAFTRAADVANVKATRLPSGRALTAGETRALFADCAADPTPAGVRDAAILAVTFGGGLRRGEVAALDVGDYTPADRSLRVRSGKGRKERMTYLPTGAADALAAWVEVRGDDPGALFVPIDKAGRLTVRPMTPAAVYGVLRKRGARAGVQFTPHDLRRSFTSGMLDGGADIATVSRLLGHASITTTARYDQRGERAKRQAVDVLHVPYQRR